MVRRGRAIRFDRSSADLTFIGANYSEIASRYIKEWQQLGIAADANPPHTTLNYTYVDGENLVGDLC
jgi:hypothetical protein